MFCYCLFCQTSHCKAIVQIMENRSSVRAFYPQIVTRQRINKKLQERQYDLLPGYVFVFTQEPLRDFLLFSDLVGVLRVLGIDEGMSGLQGTDAAFAQRIYENGGILHHITVLREGSRVKLKDPLFEGCECFIEQIDYRKERAKIRFQFDKRDWSAWIACDVFYQV